MKKGKGDKGEKKERRRRKRQRGIRDSLYETGEGETLRAKAASNMAVVCEMRDDFTAAIDWAKKSYDLFNQPAVRERNIEELRSMVNYIKLLQQRQKEIPHLQEQMDRRR